MLLSVFGLYSLNLFLSRILKVFCKTTHLHAVGIDFLQSHQSIALVPVAEHVVLSASCCLGGILVLHNSMALVIDNRIELVFKQLLVRTEIGKGCNHDSFTFLVRGSAASLVCPIIKVSDVKAKVLSVIYPVFYFLLTWGYDKDSSFALLHHSLDDTKSRVCLTRSCAVGEHISFAVGMGFVLVALVEELGFCFQYIVLLLRKEEWQGLFDVLPVAHLHFRRLCKHLLVELLAQRFFQTLSQNGISLDACPFAYLVGLAIHLPRHVPHLSDILIDVCI